MRKKTLLTAIIVSAFLGSLVLVQDVEVVEAETLGPLVLQLQTSNSIEIFSPQNATYYSDSVFVKFNVKAFYSVYDVGYSLDEGSIERISGLKFVKSEDTPGVPTLQTVYYLGSFYLTDLEDGNHSITVYQGAMYSNGYHEYTHTCVNFTVNSAPPAIANLSIENRTYNLTDLPLNFTVDKQVSWVGYSLDGEANVTLSGNTTLSGLSDGVHSIVVYANDTAGNMGKSSIILFSVQTEPTPTPTPTPTQTPTPMPTETPNPIPSTSQQPAQNAENPKSLPFNFWLVVAVVVVAVAAVSVSTFILRKRSKR